MDSEAMANSDLLELFVRRDLLLITGKGGVGKSTVTAAFATLAAQQRGGAVAVESAAHPRLPDMLVNESRVEVRNLDVEVLLPAFLGRLAKLPQLLSALLSNRVVRLFLRTAPAVGELVFLDGVYEVVEKSRSKGYPVVVDLPASGHAMTLLGTPMGVRRLVRVGPVARLAEKLESLLFDKTRCELIVVALPEELPINETIELVRRAREVGISCRTIVVNQVPVPPVVEQEREWLDRIESDGKGELGVVAGAARSELDQANHARQQIDRLRQEVVSNVVELPRNVNADPSHCVDQLVQVLAT